MKNNLWVEDQKNHSKNSKRKSTKQYINPELLSIDNNNFYRINGNRKINTTGEQPLILYKKRQNKISHSFEYKMTKKNKNNDNIYISDGGLKLKNQKYKTKYNYIYTKPINQYNEEVKSLITNYALIYEKSAKKNNTINPKDNNRAFDEKIYYKTVRGFSNRPTFKKKYYNKSQEMPKNKIKIKKNLNKYEESKQNEDNNKDLLKENLIKGGKKNIRLLLKLIKNKKMKKNKNVEKKKEYLMKNGIGLSDVIFQNFDEEEKKQPEKDEIKKMSSTGNNFHRKINNYMKNYPGMSTEKKNICFTLENDNFKNKNSQNKKQYKPIVDQFEFIKKINEEQKIIHTQENISKTKEQKEKLFLTLKRKNNQLNDSFRHHTQNSHKKKSKSKEKEKEKESLSKKKKKELPSSLIDILKDEWPYSHKKSYRSPRELKTFKKEKRVLKREKANIEELEKNTKLFNKYKNLVNLNYKRGMQNKDKDGKKNKNIEKLTVIKSLDINKSHRDNHIRKHFPIKKGKELNEYYIGNNSIINNNNSTLVEIDRYYLNVLESQKLLVDSGFSPKNFNDENNDISENEKKFDEDNINKIFKKNKNDMRNIKHKNIKINNFIKHKDKINNKKTKVIKKINSKDVLKLVEVIKFVIQRKVYATIYKYYIDLEIHKNYHLAFSYLVAICKNYAYRKIIAYSDYQSYHIIIKKLFLPFIRKNFRYFIGILNFKRKLKYFVFILNKFFKYKVLEKIYNAAHIEENPAKYFKMVIFKIMKTLFKPHLKEVFDKLNNYNSNEKYNKLIPEKEDIKINKIQKEKNNTNSLQNSQENSDKYKKIAKRYLEYSPTYTKAKSYIYESFSEDNSFSVRPNSLDNHQWAKIQAKLQLARYRIMSEEFENEEIEDNTEENDSDKINDHILSNRKEHKKGKKIDKEKEKEKVINIKKNKNKKSNNSDESSISLKDDLIKNIKDINEVEHLNNKDINKEIKNNDIKKDKPIEVDENKNNLMKVKTLSDNDISAERDDNNEIEWEYSLEDRNNKNNNIKNNKEEKKEKINLNNNEQNNKKIDLIDDSDEEKEDGKIDNNKKQLTKDRKHSNNEEDDYLGEFENVDSDIKSDSEHDSSRKKDKKEQKEEPKEIKQEKKEEKKETEIKIKGQEKKKEEENKKLEDNKIPSKEKESNKLINLNNIKDLDKFSNELTEEIIKKIISSEIASQEIKLIPYKSFKYDIFSNLNLSQSNSANGSAGANNINKELGLLGLNQLSLTDDLNSLNDSIMSSYSAFSIFNKTVKDKKKEHSLNLYFKKIAPRLIKLIKEEIIKKYPRIHANISTPPEFMQI